MSRYKIPMMFMLLCSAAGTVFAIAGPRILGQATTKLFKGLIAKVDGTGVIDFAGISRILLTVLILYLISAAFLLAATAPAI